MVWPIDYTETAKGQLRKLDRQAARRIVDFMDERIAGLESPRSTDRSAAQVDRCPHADAKTLLIHCVKQIHASF